MSLDIICTDTFTVRFAFDTVTPVLGAFILGFTAHASPDCVSSTLVPGAALTLALLSVIIILACSGKSKPAYVFSAVMHFTAFVCFCIHIAQMNGSSLECMANPLYGLAGSEVFFCLAVALSDLHALRAMRLASTEEKQGLLHASTTTPPV
jgi:hypothetical protein